jgi:trehalose synthase-fused probable maltokinase
MRDGLDVAGLDRLVEQIPHERLARQRWFRSKGREIADLALDESAPLTPQPGELDAALLVVRVSFRGDGPDERYALPMVFAPDEGGGAAGDVGVRDAASGRLLREPRDGEGVWRRLAAATRAEMALPGLHGSFAFHALAALDELVPSAREAIGALEERRLRVEQSNTSVVLGERLLLKLYRSLEPGENPDLELPRFLAEVGFAHAPAVAGYARYLPARGEPAAVLMLQEYLAGAGDAWHRFTERLAAGEGAGLLDEAVAIGRISGELHAALASRPDDPDFPARPSTAAEREAWEAGALRQLDGALTAVDGGPRARLAAAAPRLRERLARVAAAEEATVQRIHGDYHLGQLLVRGDRYHVIDFEGEPARPLAERRAPGSPLRDVAGMLRSFDYAARTALRGEAGDAWVVEARRRFLSGYADAAPGGAPDPELLAALELEKALYEVRYEAGNRPEWLWLPLAALERDL